MTSGGAINLRARVAGVLLHPTSLPGPHGSGDLGREAFDFARLLSAAGQRYWQMLPVGPSGYGNSPYSAQSAFAGNPLLISLSALADDGLLGAQALHRPPRFPRDRVAYAEVMAFREPLLRQAFLGRDRAQVEEFAASRGEWLEDFALYRALKRAHREVAWTRWPRDLGLRDPAALARARVELAEEIDLVRFEQWAFARQWARLRQHCAQLGVALIGDLPLFVAHDSADVWAHRELFQLDQGGNPAVVAGVPPDYFSATGQRWGNPLYDWSAHAKSGYCWWTARLGATLDRFDVVRLDHFIGFERYWEIPGSEQTAERGRWMPGPSDALFTALQARLTPGKALPLIAEDLGLVTPEVHALRDRFGLPGIKILQFAFGTDPQARLFLPHAYPRNCAAYTGTHDNDTTVGWFHGEGGERDAQQAAHERRVALDYLGSTGDEIHWEMIREIYRSVANLSLVPAQDLLGLGSEARMNRPGTLAGNWEWRLREGALDAKIAARLAGLVRTYGRGALE